MFSTKRQITATALGGVGIVTAVAMTLIGDTSDLRSVWAGEAIMILLSGPSAAFAGLATASLFGRPGLMGWGLALLGAVLATAIGAGIAGTVILPMFGTLLAPLMLMANMLDAPGILLIWLAGMTGVHLFLADSTGEC